MTIGLNVNHGSSPEEPLSLVEKRCTNMGITSYLTYLTTSYLIQETGEGGGGGKGQNMEDSTQARVRV